MEFLVIPAGLATGIVLGLFGSGGSILTMPALMYLLGVETKPAIAMSLGIVAVTAAVSAISHWRQGNVNLPVTAVFGLFGAAGTYVGARVGVVTPDLVQLVLFSAIMYSAAYKMLRPSAAEPKGHSLVHPGCSGGATVICLDYVQVGHVALHGIVVGILTGMVGVGGGFLIVPALVLLSGLPMKEAVGTSLVIVVAKSLAGFAGYVGAIAIDYTLMAGFTGIAVMGSFAGTMVSKRLSQAALKKGFAVFLILIATYILFRELL